MAIDTTIFMGTVAAQAYAVGDVIPMSCTDGPANVRAGRGAALLKRMYSFKIGGNGAQFVIQCMNSDWIDPVINEAPQPSATILDRRTGTYQSGNNCPLTQNSSWNCYAVCVGAGTATAGTLVHMIETDYPEVSSIVDPDAIPGIPTSIMDALTVSEAAASGGVSAAWASHSVDFFKAGYEYALQKVSAYGGGGNTTMIFVKVSNAAGMGGLERIIPIFNDPASIRAIVEYASKLQKGPLTISAKAIGTSGTDSLTIVFDFVKRKL